VAHALGVPVWGASCPQPVFSRLDRKPSPSFEMSLAAITEFVVRLERHKSWT
jgi:hypothetical protein